MKHKHLQYADFYKFNISEKALLLRNDGKKQQRLGCAGIDKAVWMAFGAVVARAGGKALLAVVIKAAGIAADDIDYLAVGLVRVQTYRAARLKPSTHNFVNAVVERAEHRVVFAALETRIGHLVYLVEIYNPIRLLCLL